MEKDLKLIIVLFKPEKDSDERRSTFDYYHQKQEAVEFYQSLKAADYHEVKLKEQIVNDLEVLEENTIKLSDLT